jgi:hypothetical protein
VEPTLPSQAVESVLQFDARVESLFSALGESYERLPEKFKFFFQLGVLTLGEIKLVAQIAKGPALVEQFLKGSKFAAGVAKAVAEGAEFAHKFKFVQEITPEIAELLGAYGEGYPVMSAVIRGDFSTRYVERGGVKLVVDHKYVPSGSSLALSVKTTKFPRISVKVTRSAAAKLDKNDPSYSNVLPWSGHVKDVITRNPFGSNAPYEVSSGEGEFGRGREAVEKLHEATSQLPAVANTVERDFELTSNFASERAEAPAPGCGGLLGDEPTNPKTTICWAFSDGRP